MSKKPRVESHMPLDESKLPFKIPRDDYVRPKVAEAAKMITNRIPLKSKKRAVTVDDPEYWGLAGSITDEMAEIALTMKVRTPRTFDKIQELTDIEPLRLQELLDEMSNIGFLEYNWENPEREKQYVVPLFVPGSAEFFNMNWNHLQENPELAAFFERMSFMALEKITPMVPPGGAGIGMHVIPVEKAIPMENETADVEHISHWLKKYEGKYAASPCSCRYSRKIMNEGCADDPEDWCIAVGDMADYVVETNKGGRYIDYDEVMRIMKKAEDRGYVHQITNIDGENKIFAICNCNVNVCYALRTSLLFNTPNLSRSAYVARITTENCVACGSCVEHCPAGAIKLGQKLCTKDGAIEYPVAELPDKVKWGPEKWDIDYRNNNRINTHDTGTAPCKTACPANISVQGYLKMAAQGRYTEALALIKEKNPFPAVCGRICNRPCEDACTRGIVDQPIAIDDIKNFIAQKDLDATTRYIPPIIPPIAEKDKLFEQKIAIIGAGPAGLSCAYYLAVNGYKPTVFEKNEKPGGMLTYGVPSYKLEKDVIDAEIDIIRELGVDIRCGVEVGKDITLDQLRAEGYEGFYLAIGCQGSRKAGIPGEDAEGVMSAVDLLHTVSDNEDYKVKGKTVVIGGGNVAIDVARTSLRCGSDEVLMFCLEDFETMPATDEEVAEALEEGVKIDCSWGPKEILLEDGKVKGIVLKRCTSVCDETGCFNPAYDECELMTVDCDNVFLSIGQSVEWGSLLAGSKVELRGGGTVMADAFTYQTAEADIFVGGDVYTGPKFAIDAIAAGKVAAESLHRFVQPNSSLTIGRDRRHYVELDKDNLVIGEYDKAPRQKAAVDKSVNNIHSFRDGRKVFTEEQVKIETARCLDCGTSVVDQNKCIGCGVCTTKCEFDAIHLYRERPECSKMVVAEEKMKSILPYMLKRQLKITFSPKKAK